MTSRTEILDAREFESLEIPQDHYFVLGDNRDKSFDSRTHGPIPRSVLHAKVGIVYLSVGDGYSIRWNRLGRLIR